MDLNDTANDFKETKTKRAKFVSNTKNKLSRRKKQKLESEVVEEVAPRENNYSQHSSHDENISSSNEVIIKATNSSCVSSEKFLLCNKYSVSKDTAGGTGQNVDLARNEAAFCAVLTKTESEVSSTEIAAVANSTLNQNVVSSSKTSPQQSERSVSTTTKSDYEPAVEKWCCIFCNSSLPPMERNEHVKSCFLQFEYKTAAKKGPSSYEKDCSAAFFCEVCKKDISHLCLQNRNEHINSCIDSQKVANKAPLPSHDPVPEANPECINISECPVCGKQFTSLETRLIHVKKCCKKHNMEPQQVIIALQLQEKHALERIAIGLPPLQIKPSSVKSNTNQRQRKRKAPSQMQVMSDPDLQIAMALSLSLEEEEKRKQEALTLLLDEPSDLTLSPQKSGCDRLPLELKPPTENQVPGKAKPKSKKNNINRAIPILLLRTEEERLKLMQERISSIIAPGSPRKELPQTSGTVISETPITVIADEGSESSQNVGELQNSAKHCELWSLSGLAAEKDTYYVSELQEWVSLSEIDAGSKLKNLSQLPGHKISHDLVIEHSTFYTNEDRDFSSSQNCTVESLGDIPSTQEMLDVITKDDTFVSKIIVDSHEQSELSFSHRHVNFRGELKNDGFFPEMQKDFNQNLANPIIDCLRKLVGNSWMSDVNITVAEHRSIPAHKLLLMMRCPSVAKELKESDNGISLLDWSCTSFRAAMEFLKFIYSGSCLLNCPDKEEICRLFYRYDMAEAYETLKNVVGATNEERNCDHDASCESNTDADILQESLNDAENCKIVKDQEKILECQDAHEIHPRNSCYDVERTDLNIAVSSSQENNCTTKTTPSVSDCNSDNTISSLKHISPCHHFSQFTNSSNHDTERLKEEATNLTSRNSFSFSPQTLYQSAMSPQYSGVSFLRKNSSSKYSEIINHGNKQSALICDEDIKYLCSPNEEHYSNLQKVFASSQSTCSLIQNSNLKEIVNATEKLLHSFNGCNSPEEFKNQPTICEKVISPLKHNISIVQGRKSFASSAGTFYQVDDKEEFVAENHDSRNLAVDSVRSSNDSLDTSHSTCSFSPKPSGGNSPDIFVCDSDEELHDVHSLDNIQSKCHDIGVLHSPSLVEETHYSHLSEVSVAPSQNLISKSPDPEIVFVNEVSCKNGDTSESYALEKPSKLGSLESESDSSSQIRNSHKNICGLTNEGNDYLPDLIVYNAQINSAETFSTPMSSKSNSSFKQQKRKLLRSISPTLVNKSYTSFKKIRVSAQETDPPVTSHVSDIEDAKFIGDHEVAVSDGTDMAMHKTFDQPEVLNMVVNKPQGNTLPQNKSFSALPQSYDDDNSEAELEAICANGTNGMPDVWEEFDDGGFREDTVTYGSCNSTVNYNSQMLTPLKHARNRPPTPHPSSAQKFSKKLSFVDEDAHPSTPPVHSPVELVDVDSSPILMRPLRERLGLVNQGKKSSIVKDTQKEVPDIRLQHKEIWWDSMEQVDPASQVITPEIKNAVKSKGTQNYAVTSSPITPMPDFQKMVSPELKDQLKKYGVRALPRRKAVTLLTHIYDETHPWQMESELYCKSQESVAYGESTHCLETSPAKLASKNMSQQCKSISVLSSPKRVKEHEKQKATKTSKPCRRKENKAASNGKTSKKVEGKSYPQEENHEEFEKLNISSSQTSSVSESSDFPEESILKTDEDSDGELITPSQIESLEERISNYILSDQSMYTKILMYEPLNLSDFQQHLKQQGIKVGQTKLMDYLDDQCITFTLPRSEKQQKKQQERCKRFRKRVLAKCSQNC